MATALFAKNRTFRPKKKWEKGTIRYDLHKKAKATLNSGLDMRAAVALPDEEEYPDWIAVHVVDFFNRINLIYGAVCEFCTEASCPIMTGGPKYEYYWADDVQKKPVKISAPEYISRLMTWIEKQINDEALFPPTTGIPFPKQFMPAAKKIFTRMYRVFVHVYIHHFDKLIAIGAEAHINTCYKHFYYFVTEFKLMDVREFEPLADLTARICR